MGGVHRGRVPSRGGGLPRTVTSLSSSSSLVVTQVTKCFPSSRRKPLASPLTDFGRNPLAHWPLKTPFRTVGSSRSEHARLSGHGPSAAAEAAAKTPSPQDRKAKRNVDGVLVAVPGSFLGNRDASTNRENSTSGFRRAPSVAGRGFDRPGRIATSTTE